YLYLNSLHRPRSTLFPYTTLFRSESENAIKEMQIELQDFPRRGVGAMMRIMQEHAKAELALEVKNVIHQPGMVPFMQDDDIGPADRKSTRLNSSHQINSYAVFCLK